VVPSVYTQRGDSFLSKGRRPLMLSASIFSVDEKKHYVWINYQGITSELLFNLKAYGIDYITEPSHPGQIGLPYQPWLEKAKLETFKVNAVKAVSLLIQPRIAHYEEQVFLNCLVIVQDLQREAREAVI
jgi:hypothetical protein